MMFFHYFIEDFIVHKEVERWGEAGSHLSHLLRNLKNRENRKKGGAPHQKHNALSAQQLDHFIRVFGVFKVH